MPTRHWKHGIRAGWPPRNLKEPAAESNRQGRKTMMQIIIFIMMSCSSSHLGLGCHCRTLGIGTPHTMEHTMRHMMGQATLSTA